VNNRQERSLISKFGLSNPHLQKAGGQEFRSSGVQEFRSTGVQEFRSTGVQGVQEFRSSGVRSQEFRSIPTG
jgi:hypothetical protein